MALLELILLCTHLNAVLHKQCALNVSPSSLYITEDAVFAEPGPGGGTMMAGAVYTLPAQRNVPLPMAMQRLIPMATQGGKPRSFTLPRDSNLHTLFIPPTREEQQPHNGEFSQEHACVIEHLNTWESPLHRVGCWTSGKSAKRKCVSLWMTATRVKKRVKTLTSVHVPEIKMLSGRHISI